jgi:microcystin-dependent protein
MAEPFLGEIRIMSFDYAPQGWAQCNGQLLPINQNQAMFSLLGTTFGGDGRTTFGLPNLQARIPIHFGVGHVPGERGGEDAHTLSEGEMAAHTHFVNVSSASTGGNSVPTGRFLGSANNMYHQASNLTPINPLTVGKAGGGQAHPNDQPYLALNFCIAMVGIFPSPN